MTEAYVPTHEDALWLLRAVQFEGPPHQRVAQALINRFMFLRSTQPGAYKTIAAFVQAYARPVNPAWGQQGTQYEAALQAATSDTERARLKRVASKIAKQRRFNDFSATTMSAVVEALVRPRSIGEITDYGAPYRETPDHLELVEGHAEGMNSFYRVKGGSWQGYYSILRAGLHFLPGCDPLPLKANWGLELLSNTD